MGNKTAKGIHAHTIKIRRVLFSSVFFCVVRVIDCDRPNSFELSVKIEQNTLGEWNTPIRCNQNALWILANFTNDPWLKPTNFKLWYDRFHHCFCIAWNAQFKGTQWWEFIIPHLGLLHLTFFLPRKRIPCTRAKKHIFFARKHQISLHRFV